MKAINRNQGGFSSVEIILIIVIVGAIGLVGWFVYHTKQSSDKSLDQATTTSQNAGPHFAKPKESKSKPSTTTTQ